MPHPDSDNSLFPGMPLFPPSTHNFSALHQQHLLPLPAIQLNKRKPAEYPANIPIKPTLPVKSSA
jgi:hypothetical protein